MQNADIAEAGTFDEVTELLDRGGEIDLVLLDLSMPGARGFSGLMYLRAQHPGVPVAAGRPALGTWQGLYLIEHRRLPHAREVVFQFLGSRA